MKRTGFAVASVFCIFLTACTTTNDVAEQEAASAPINRGVAAFRDICFSAKAPFPNIKNAAAKYGITKFEAKQGKSWLSGEYVHYVGSNADGSLIVGYNPSGERGVCTVRERRDPGITPDAIVKKQMEALIKTKYPKAFKMRETSENFTVFDTKWHHFDIGVSLNFKGYNIFG
ncbi:hypothetical protein ACLBWS_02365 [Brucellaceae bacterium D45D]